MTSPVHSHRRGLRLGTTARRVAAVALVLATLAIGARIEPYTTDSDAQQRPFIRTGGAGSVVNARTFTASVLGVRGADAISQNGESHVSTGVWILVRVRLTALRNPAAVTYAVLRDAAGRIYQATGRIDQALLDGEQFQPGVPVVTELAFEVPTSVATGLSIQLDGDPGGTSEDIRMDALAQIRVPISAAQVRQWKADTEPLEVSGRQALG